MSDTTNPLNEGLNIAPRIEDDGPLVDWDGLVPADLRSVVLDCATSVRALFESSTLQRTHELVAEVEHAVGRAEWDLAGLGVSDHVEIRALIHELVGWESLCDALHELAEALDPNPLILAVRARYQERIRVERQSNRAAVAQVLAERVGAAG